MTSDINNIGTRNVMRLISTFFKVTIDTKTTKNNKEGNKPMSEIILTYKLCGG
jgi:hypothetical protein